MRKLFMITVLATLGLGLSSCVCECVGPNDQNPNNKICKTEYENAYGPGTWANYEASAKYAGYVCK